MQMRRRTALPRCARRWPNPAGSGDSLFSRWLAGLTTIRFSFRGSRRLECSLFPAGMDTAIGPMSTPRRKISPGGRWCLRSRWQSCRFEARPALFLRHAKKLRNAPRNSRVVEGDVLHKEQLNHDGRPGYRSRQSDGNDIDRQAKNIVDAMSAA